MGFILFETVVGCYLSSLTEYCHFKSKQKRLPSTLIIYLRYQLKSQKVRCPCIGLIVNSVINLRLFNLPFKFICFIAKLNSLDSVCIDPTVLCLSGMKNVIRYRPISSLFPSHFSKSSGQWTFQGYTNGTKPWRQGSENRMLVEGARGDRSNQLCTYILYC